MQDAQQSYFDGLGRQALGRPLTAQEEAFAKALESIYVAGVHAADAAAARLAEAGVARPSGEAGPWTAEILLGELRAINTSLDRAYANVRIASNQA